MENNLSKTFNGWISYIKEPNPSEKIKVIVMSRICVKRDFGSKWSFDLTLRIVKVFDKNIEKSSDWEP